MNISHVLHESEKLCLIKTMVEGKNSQTRIAAVHHHIACWLNKDTEYSVTCGMWSKTLKITLRQTAKTHKQSFVDLRNTTLYVF